MHMKPYKLGFTLIELLVVIAIIALLIGILLPVLSSARASARQVKCASSLRQISITHMGYMEDFKDFIVSAERYNSRIPEAYPGMPDEERLQQWFVILDSYAGGGFDYAYQIEESRKDVSLAWGCPEFEELDMNGDPLPPENIGTGYGANVYVEGVPNVAGGWYNLNWHSRDNTAFSQPWIVDNPLDRAKNWHVDEITRSSERVFIGDADDYWFAAVNDVLDPFDLSMMDPYRHMGDPNSRTGAGNYLFHDGHVSTLADQELFDLVRAE